MTSITLSGRGLNGSTYETALIDIIPSSITKSEDQVPFHSAEATDHGLTFSSDSSKPNKGSVRSNNVRCRKDKQRVDLDRITENDTLQSAESISVPFIKHSLIPKKEGNSLESALNVVVPETRINFKKVKKNRKSGRDKIQSSAEDESRTIVHFQIATKRKGRLITGRSGPRRTRSVPTALNQANSREEDEYDLFREIRDKYRFKVKLDRSSLEFTPDEQAGESGNLGLLSEVDNKSGRGGAVLKEGDVECSCRLPDPKYCMVHLMEAVSRMRKSPPRRHIAWLPMSVCSTYR